MNIYETGNAAISRVNGEHYKTRQFVVVVDTPQEKTLSQAFDEFKAFIDEKKGIAKIDDFELGCYTKNGDFYQLSHEIIHNKYRKSAKPAAIDIKPSNLLRYLNSRHFRYENLYINEQDQLIDITTHAIQDIRRNTMIPQIDLKAFINVNYSIALKILYRCIVFHWLIDNNFADELFNNMSPYLPPIPEDNEQFKSILQHNPKQLVRFSGRYPLLFRYLFDTGNLKINIETIQHNKKEKINYKPYNPVIDQNMFVVDGNDPIEEPEDILRPHAEIRNVMWDHIQPLRQEEINNNEVNPQPIAPNENFEELARRLGDLDILRGFQRDRFR